jgi:hypothetical protein
MASSEPVFPGSIQAFDVRKTTDMGIVYQCSGKVYVEATSTIAADIIVSMKLFQETVGGYCELN